MLWTLLITALVGLAVAISSLGQGDPSPVDRDTIPTRSHGEALSWAEMAEIQTNSPGPSFIETILKPPPPSER